MRINLCLPDPILSTFILLISSYNAMNNSKAWINVGYDLFAQEGHEGLQIERIARILNLNKSGFYHYFGTHDIFFEYLVQHHHRMVDLLIKDIGNIRTFDPGYLQVLINHPVTVMANLQMMRNRHINLFEQTFNEVSHKINGAIVTLWSEHLGLPDQPELAMRYFEMTQALFYTRVTSQNLNYELLHQIISEAKEIFDDLVMSERFFPVPQIMRTEFLNGVSGFYAQTATQ